MGWKNNDILFNDLIFINMNIILTAKDGAYCWMEDKLSMRFTKISEMWNKTLISHGMRIIVCTWSWCVIPQIMMSKYKVNKSKYAAITILKMMQCGRTYLNKNAPTHDKTPNEWYEMCYNCHHRMVLKGEQWPFVQAWMAVKHLWRSKHTQFCYNQWCHMQA